MIQIVIDIDGVVGEGNNTVIAIKEKVVPYSGMEINVIVNIRSTGGLLDEALKIYDYLNWLGKLEGVTVETRCFGYVASCGTIIAQGATEGHRGISKNSLYLIHCSTCDVENETYIGLGKMRDTLMLKDEFISKIYAQHSKGVLDQKAVIEIMEENEGAGYWQDPHEVVEHGLADFIFDADEELEKLETPKQGLFYKIKKFFGYGR